MFYIQGFSSYIILGIPNSIQWTERCHATLLNLTLIKITMVRNSTAVSMLLVTSMLVVLVLVLSSSVSGQTTYRRYNEACDNDFGRCEPNKGYMCKGSHCVCGNGFYSALKDKCVVKFGQGCFAGSHDRYSGLAGVHLDCDDSFAYCNQLTSLCECRRGYDCSSAAATKTAISFTNLCAVGFVSLLSLVYSFYST